METYNFNRQERVSLAQSRVKSIKRFYIHAIIFIFVNALIIADCAAENLQSLFTIDSYKTAFFWGIGLAAHGMFVFGQDLLFGRNWEEKEIRKILYK